MCALAQDVMKDNLLTLLEIEILSQPGYRTEQDGMIHYHIEIDESDTEKTNIIRRLMYHLMKVNLNPNQN